jgi:hypothetical protein
VVPPRPTHEQVTRELGGRVLMGIGTILDDVTARLAILAG